MQSYELYVIGVTYQKQRSYQYNLSGFCVGEKGKGINYSVKFHKRNDLFSHQGVLWKKLSGSKIKMSWVWDFVMNSTQVYKGGPQSLKHLEKVQIDIKGLLIYYFVVSLSECFIRGKNLNSSPYKLKDKRNRALEYKKIGIYKNSILLKVMINIFKMC